MATFCVQCSPMPPRRNFHPLPQLPLPNASPAFLATQPTPLRRRREESTVSPPRKFFAASTRKVVRKPQSLPKTEIPLQLPRQLDASLNQLMTSWDLTSNRIFRASEPPLYLSSFLILKLIDFIQSSGHLVPLLKILKFHKPTPMEAPGPNATFMVIYKHWVLHSISHQSFGLFPWNPEMIWASPWGWYYHNVPHKWNMNF